MIRWFIAVLVVLASACSLVVQDTRTPEEKETAEAVHATQTATVAFVPTATDMPEPPPIPTFEPQVLPEGCLVKGNVSSRGEKIYHVEGQANYARVIIDPEHGERCFETEEEAVAAGWRKALR